MVVEVAATRLLTPYFGASLFIWTSAISVVLAALAVGYFVGSKLSKKEDLYHILSRTFVAASLATLAVTYMVFIIGKFLPTFYSGNIPSVSAFILTFIAALVSMMPAGIFFGIVSPIIIEILGRDGHHPGTVAGNVFSVSTVGSILGTISTPLIFFPMLGTHLTFAVIAVLTMLLAGIVARKKKFYYILAAFVILMAGLFYRPSLFNDEKVVLAMESPYQTIRILEDGDRLSLVFNEGHGVQSVYNPDSPWTGSYWDWSAILPYLRGHQDQSALIIGFAGGTIPRIWSQTPVSELISEIDGVEVDPAVIEVGKEYFNIDQIDANIIIKDGRQHLVATDKLYDIIYVDAYANEFQIPFHLATVEFYQLTQEHLADNGLLAFNIALGIRDSELMKGLLNSISYLYPNVYTLQEHNGFNMLVVASQNEIDFSNIGEIYKKSAMPNPPEFNIDNATFNPDGRIFTDDNAPIELLSDLTLLEYL